MPCSSLALTDSLLPDLYFQLSTHAYLFEDESEHEEEEAKMNIYTAIGSLCVITVITSFCADYRALFDLFGPAVMTDADRRSQQSSAPSTSLRPTSASPRRSLVSFCFPSSVMLQSMSPPSGWL